MLVNGASGGVGTFVVQIAKALGAVVTGVCSSQEHAAGRLASEPTTSSTTPGRTSPAPEQYDLLIDVAGSRSLSATRRVLQRSGVLVGVGGPNKGRFVGPLSRRLMMAMLSPAVSQRMVFFLAQQNNADLIVLSELIESAKVTPIVDRTYPLTEAADAMRYLEEGHARGKVVVTM